MIGQLCKDIYSYIMKKELEEKIENNSKITQQLLGH
jgi:hypothetical protein